MEQFQFSLTFNRCFRCQIRVQLNPRLWSDTRCIILLSSCHLRPVCDRHPHLYFQLHACLSTAQVKSGSRLAKPWEICFGFNKQRLVLFTATRKRKCIGHSLRCAADISTDNREMLITAVVVTSVATLLLLMSSFLGSWWETGELCDIRIRLRHQFYIWLLQSEPGD